MKNTETCVVITGATGGLGRALCDYYHLSRAAFAGSIWLDGTSFEKAYLIHLFQYMIEDGVDVRMVTTDGEYMEIDTEEDYALANVRWPQEYGD